MAWVETLQEILVRHSDAKMLLLIHWPTRRITEIRLPKDLARWDILERVWVYRSSLP